MVKQKSIPNIFLIFSLLALICTNTMTYIMLINNSAELNRMLIEKQGQLSMITDALSEHMYYDGDSIKGNQTVRHYSPSGEIIGSERVDNLLCGDKVVLLLTSNSCSSCAKEEISNILDLSMKIGREHVIIITDFELHTHRAWTVCFDKEGFYETDLKHLGMVGSPTQNSPILMLTHNGRVKTSFVVSLHSINYVGIFYEYLFNFFKEAI